jgi:PKD repeat protein
MHTHVGRYAAAVVLALAALAQPARAWTVINAAASGSGSFNWVAQQISAGLGDSSVSFAIPGPGPHVIPGTATFENRRVTINGHPDVTLGCVVYCHAGGALYNLRCTGASVALYQGGNITDGGRFVNSYLMLAGTGCTYTANNSFSGGGIAVGDGVTLRGISNAFVTLASGGTLADSAVTVLTCAGAGNDVQQCWIGGTNQHSTIQGDHNYLAHCTVVGAAVGGTLGGGLRIIGASNVVEECHCYSNAYAVSFDGSYNTLRRCVIGVAQSGAQALPNLIGVEVKNGAGNVIGGDPETERNSISGNLEYGIYAVCGSALRIEGNYIGTSVDGGSAVPNSAANAAAHAVYIALVTNATVGGIDRGNLIAGNHGSGVRAANAPQLRVVNNLIGTGKTGVGPQPNGGTGVDIQDSYDVIVSGNVIAGATAGYGVGIFDAGYCYVWGNHIGVNAPGTSAIPNALGGIYLDNCLNSVVGGTNAQNRNVISGNGGDGIFCYRSEVGSAGWVRIINNYVGVDATGTGALGNAQAGIFSGAWGTEIGGTNWYERNVLSANGRAGIELHEYNAFCTRIYGNYIGTDAAGARSMGGHAVAGVILGGCSNWLGGLQAGMGNLITASGGHGVLVTGGAFFSHHNCVAGNTIARNGGSGIGFANNAVKNTFAGNTFEDNALMAVDLWPLGYTYAEFESENMPNYYRRFPWLSRALSAGGSTVVYGALTSAVSMAFVIECYAAAGLSPGGYSHGRPLGSIAVSTDAGGVAIFTAQFAAAVAPGALISAIATDALGNSSELGPPVAVEGLQAAFTADPLVTVTNDPVQFTDCSHGTPLAWWWDFDNNGSVESTQQHPAYAYAAPGRKAVKLTVSNAVGVSSVVRTNYIYVAGRMRWAEPGTGLQSIIDASAPGDVIALSNGIYNGAGRVMDGTNVLVLDKDIVVLGSGGGSVGRALRRAPQATPAEIIIDGQHLHRCAQIVSGTVMGVTFANGCAGGSADRRGAPLGDDADGGGVVCRAAGTLERCIIRNCQAGIGGGLALYGGTAKSCLIVSNSADEGGGVALRYSAMAYNLTIADNAASSSAGGAAINDAQVWNSIVYFNTAPANANWSALNSVFSYACAVPAPPEPHSIATDPGFLPDYSIDPLSPCANRGLTFGWMDSAADLAGDARVQGDNVDLGAYEAVPEPAALGLLGLVTIYNVRFTMWRKQRGREK